MYIGITIGTHKTETRFFISPYIFKQFRKYKPVFESKKHEDEELIGYWDYNIGFKWFNIGMKIKSYIQTVKYYQAIRDFKKAKGFTGDGARAGI